MQIELAGVRWTVSALGTGSQTLMIEPLAPAVPEYTHLRFAGEDGRIIETTGPLEWEHEDTLRGILAEELAEP